MAHSMLTGLLNVLHHCLRIARSSTDGVLCAMLIIREILGGGDYAVVTGFMHRIGKAYVKHSRIPYHINIGRLVK